MHRVTTASVYKMGYMHFQLQHNGSPCVNLYASLKTHLALLRNISAIYTPLGANEMPYKIHDIHFKNFEFPINFSLACYHMKGLICVEWIGIFLENCW